MNPNFFHKVFLILLLLFSSTHLFARKIYPEKGGDGGLMIVAANLQIKPGDTLILRATESPFTYCYLGGLEGEPNNWITIINEGGVVELSTGFDIEHCQYLKVLGTGTGTGDDYGFSVRNSKGVAVTIHGKSAHIEVEKLEALNCAFGCWIKNEASCDESINDWVLNDISFHHYKFTNIGIEGFYAGSTDANNATRPIDCNGRQKFNKPSKLGNIRIYDGLIDGTGRPAIMVSNAVVGMSQIYNNVIRRVGREYNDQQGTGISLGLYTRAHVFNNNISNTYTWGIASLGGSGQLLIEGNTIDSSGYLDGKEISWAQNILIDTRPTFPLDSTTFIIQNNFLSNPGSDAFHIQVYKSRESYGKGNIICNNKGEKGEASVRVEKGISWKDCSGNIVSAPIKPKLLWGAVALVIFLLIVFVFMRWKKGKA